MDKYDIIQNFRSYSNLHEMKNRYVWDLRWQIAETEWHIVVMKQKEKEFEKEIKDIEKQKVLYKSMIDNLYYEKKKEYEDFRDNICDKLKSWISQSEQEEISLKIIDEAKMIDFLNIIEQELWVDKTIQRKRTIIVKVWWENPEWDKNSDCKWC